MTRPHDNPVRKYGYALDEIWNLRAGAAFEAGELTKVLDYASLPVGARDILQEMQVRLQQAARGEWDDAWSHLSDAQRKATLVEAGAEETLTRASWEAERT